MSLYIVFALLFAFAAAAQEAETAALEPAAETTAALEPALDEASYEDAEIVDYESPQVYADQVHMIQPPEDIEAPATRFSQENITIKPALTDTLAENAPENAPSTLPLPDIKGTWVEKLKNVSFKGDGGEILPDVGVVEKPAGESLEGMVQSSREQTNSRRSNASVFDISGLMLRMSLEQALSVMQNRGFQKVSEKMQIPNFIKWRNEESCRNEGVVGYERLANCTIMKAKKDGHQYAESVNFAKYSTKEEISVNLTSNFTKNKVYKIIYKSGAANITGNSQKAVYIRNIKIYDFWKKINQKYGVPDNKEEVVWGLGDGKPYMHAKTGFLLLEDPMLRELDYTRMSREDQRYMNTDLYSF